MLLKLSLLTLRFHNQLLVCKSQHITNSTSTRPNGGKKIGTRRGENKQINKHLVFPFYSWKIFMVNQSFDLSFVRKRNLKLLNQMTNICPLISLQFTTVLISLKWQVLFDFSKEIFPYYLQCKMFFKEMK